MNITNACNLLILNVYLLLCFYFFFSCRHDVANNDTEIPEAMVTCICQVGLTKGNWQKGKNTFFIFIFVFVVRFVDARILLKRSSLFISLFLLLPVWPSSNCTIYGRWGDGPDGMLSQGQPSRTPWDPVEQQVWCHPRGSQFVRKCFCGYFARRGADAWRR